jgi:hypothetical protein
MISFRKTIFFFVVAVFVLACTKPAPQLPANKIKYIDSTQLALTEANNALITYEDSVLTRYVSDSCTGMIKSGQGFWYKISKSTGKERFKDKDICYFNASVYTLDGNLRIKKDYRIEISKNEVFKSLNDGLRLVGKGEIAEFVFPWYLAYGIRGNGREIPAYTSIRVIVKMK